MHFDQVQLNSSIRYTVNIIAIWGSVVVIAIYNKARIDTECVALSVSYYSSPYARHFPRRTSLSPPAGAKWTRKMPCQWQSSPFGVAGPHLSCRNSTARKREGRPESHFTYKLSARVWAAPLTS